MPRDARWKMPSVRPVRLPIFQVFIYLKSIWAARKRSVVACCKETNRIAVRHFAELPNLLSPGGLCPEAAPGSGARTRNGPRPVGSADASAARYFQVLRLLLRGH